MKDILKRLKVDRRIAEGAPVFRVLGISIVFCGAALGILSALFLILDWRFLAVAISWVFGALTACFGVWRGLVRRRCADRQRAPQALAEIGRPFADGQEHRDRPRQTPARGAAQGRPYAHHPRPNHALNRTGQARAFYVASSGAGRRLA
jgi:hypothetical protein